MTTLISFLLDRSGSMAQWKSDVIGGFNEFLRDQKEQPGDAAFVITLFDSQSVDTAKFDSIQKVPDLTEATYQPRASTPLLDAIGKTINLTDQMSADRVLFVIYTDGFENASHEYTKEAIAALVKEREANGWDFIFLGADIDAWSQAGLIGVKQGSTFSTQGGATGQTMAAASTATSAYRRGEDDYVEVLRKEADRQAKETS